MGNCGGGQHAVKAVKETQPHGIRRIEKILPLRGNQDRRAQEGGSEEIQAC